jgi:LysM repeat protein
MRKTPYQTANRSCRGKLPVLEVTSADRSATHPARTETSTPQAAEEIVATATLSASTTDTRTKSKTTHRVTRGETLFSIAKRYGTTVALIKELNSLSGNVIRVGQRLVVERLSTIATNCRSQELRRARQIGVAETPTIRPRQAPQSSNLE